MKTRYIKSLAWVALLFCATTLASCDDGDYTDWAALSTTEADEALSVGVSISAAATIDFNYVTTDRVQAFVPTVTTSDDADITYVLTLYNADGTSYVDIDADADGYAAAADIENAVATLYGKRPETRVITATVTAYVTIDGTTDKSTATTTVTVLLVAPNISEAYYIIGQPGEWTSESARTMKFNHSDKDVYDDPEFTITIAGSETSDTWFAIADDAALDAIDNDGDWSQLLGTTLGNGNNNLETWEYLDFRYNIGNDGSFYVPAGVKYIEVTINMMDYTYCITPLNYGQFIWFIGSTDGWGSPDYRLESPNYDGVYTGYVPIYDLNGWGIEYKFMRTRGEWDDEVNSSAFTSATGDCWLGDGTGNMGAYNEGVHYCVVDLPGMALSTTLIESVGIIGDFNSWGSDVAMDYDKDNNVWTATINLDTGGWKFRMNNDWTINLGGDSLDDLVADGNNLYLSEAGTYEIRLYLSRTEGDSDKIYCTATKQ